MKTPHCVILAGTVAATGEQFFAALVKNLAQALFPDDEPFKQIDAIGYMGVPLLDAEGNVLGTLPVINKRPFPREPRGVALLRIFANRAAAELQHLRTEAALREREERYRDLYDEAPIAYRSVGVDGRIRSANRRAAELSGHTMNQSTSPPCWRPPVGA